MRIAFLGSKAFGLEILRSLYGINHSDTWLIIHPTDDGDPRSTQEDFYEFARQHDLDLLMASSQVAANEMIREFRPDVALACGWYWIISQSTLRIPSLGFFGIHNSLLPKYRGGAPLVWAIMNGDKEVGSTVFQFTKGMDAGPILEQITVSLADHENISDALIKIENKMIESLPEKWSALLNGNANLIEQEEQHATYCGQRIPEDGQIDFKEPAVSIHNFVRAQSSPYPGAFCFAEGKKITVWKSAVDTRTYYGAPGQVLSIGLDHVVVSCGQSTALNIFEISVDGIPQ